MLVVGNFLVGATVVGATDGFIVGGLGSPITHALLVCPPNAAMQHSNRVVYKIVAYFGCGTVFLQPAVDHVVS
jgi:hypothetical protein